MKILKWLSNNILFVFTIFLLVFIPLYPKLPLLDVKNTWVYIRIEDIIVAVAVLTYFIQLLRKKATLNTPLTVPFIIFWTIGLVSLIYGILFIFPMLAGVFPHVAALYFIRYIEYISVFFIAYSSIKNKNSITPIVVALTVTLAAVVFYGWGQKGFIVTSWDHRFPAFSTMNEEFAKGIPLMLSPLGRVSSTFAGHYDLAAYLVMMIAIMGSLIFGVKKIWARIAFFLVATGGLTLLFMTASRVSVAVYLLTIIFLLILQKQKKYIIPVIIASVLLMQFFQGITERLASTISQVDVVVDARTGEPIGVAKTDETGKTIIEEKDLTGEDLPQGSGFINLPGGTGAKTGKVVYKKTKLKDGTFTTEVKDYKGDFVVRKALAYDVSFTTRFQGEWPRAIEAFKRNIFLGSGYSSISLATDNNYLRILGETGILGLLSFTLIFIIFGIYSYRLLPNIEKGMNRSFVIGVIAGLFGLGLNAILIDVFVASKVAFVMWMLMGLSMAILHQYEKKKIDILQELKTFFLSVPVLVFYFLIGSFLVFSFIIPNFFVGDDFTWLRWAAECKKAAAECMSIQDKIISYLINSDGFFYRPGTKIYFTFMYAVFWLHQSIYHSISIVLHFVVTALVFLLTLQLLRSKIFAFFAGCLFLVLAVHFESVFWISVSGHLIASAAILLSIVSYIYWRQTKNYLLFTLAFVSALVAPLFHEFGVVAPLIIIAYDMTFSDYSWKKRITAHWISHLLFILLIPLYLVVRYIAHSHWQGGDYSYNLVKLPFNAIGNFIGYIAISIAGVDAMPYYTAVRESARNNILFGVAGIFIVVGCAGLCYVYRKKIFKVKELPVIIFALLFSGITMLPFLGLGNITYRYAYLPSAGLILFCIAVLHMFYRLVPTKKRKIYLVGVAIFVALYGVWQIHQLRTVNKDWVYAGRVTSGLMNDVTAYYETSDTKFPNPVFYFGNVPIKKGEAWIFPVGLEDALWFPFQNENLTVKMVDNIDKAREAFEASKSARFFEFDNEGNVTIIRKEIE